MAAIASYLGNENVQKYLRMIAQAEGTLNGNSNPYQVAFGGEQIQDLSAHPNVRKQFKQTDGKTNVTTAAGAYQFIKPTWDNLQKRLNLPDFSPRSQDMAAVALLQENGALPHVLQGDFDTAIAKSGRTWASLPSSPYAQPKRSSGYIKTALGQPQQRTAQPMNKQNAIDVNQIQWDAPPQASAGFDKSKIVWDNAQQSSAQPASTPVQAGGYISEKPGVFENTLMGFVRGATDALSPIASGFTKAADWVEGGTKNHDRYTQQIAQERADFDRRYGKSGTYTAGQIGGNLLITAPVGAGIGGGVAKAGAAMGLPKLAALGSAIKTGGMAADGMKGAGGMAVRTIGGAINGAITGGMSADPDGARQGAIIGGAMPGVTKVAGVALNKMGKGVGRVIGGVSPEVKDLAIKAQQMGIDIPVDRLTNSKPLNAVASSLEYLPFSGRQGTMARMQSQANRAVARTMGQDSDNLTMAFKTAKKDLGGRFDDYLKNNGAVIDNDIVSSLAEQAQRATDELGDGAKAVLGKIDDIIAKTGPDGVIDGKAAYNIKRELDLLSKRNQTFAPYARDLRDTLMDAMNKAAGPEKAAEFSKLRQQYGNMKTIEGLIPNGAEGDISLGRLANLRGARNQDLQDVADVSAQFLKTREAPHGSLQRIMQAVTAGGMYINPWITTGTLAGGRVANSALNSNTLRKLAMNGAQMPRIQSGLLDPRLFYKMAPALAINHRQDPSPSSPSRSRK